MEKGPELSREQLDAIALGSMHHSYDDLVAYRADGGIDIMRFIDTGEIVLKSYSVGGKTMSFEVERKEPIIDRTYDSWVAYTGPRSNKTPAQQEYYRGNHEHDNNFDDERSAILSAATEQAVHLQNIERRVSCRRDCNNGMYDATCWCTHLRSSYTSIDGETVQEKKNEGEPDPNCNECEGTGHHEIRCYDCLGSGQAIINPLVSIMNNSTGEFTSFRLEAARLLADGDSPLMIERDRYARSKKSGPQLLATLDIQNFIHHKASEVGIDVASGNYTTYWGPETLETFGTTFGHLLGQISTSIDDPSQFESMDEFSTAALAKIQQSLFAQIRTDIYGINRQKDPIADIQSRGKIFDIDFNDDLTVGHVGLRLDRPLSSHAALQELIAILDQYGYRLGTTSTGIATGESGPALYILDRAGNLLQEISAGYTEQNVLETAYRKIVAAHQSGKLTIAREDDDLF